MTVFIQKGAKPLSIRAANERGERYFNAGLKQWEREAGIVTQDPLYIAWAAQWLADNVENETNNHFNSDLRKYRSAIARRAQYQLSVGQAEITEQREKPGEYDEEGNAITELVIVQEAIEPLPAEVEQSVYDEETEQTSTVMAPNPLIVQDDAERAVAQETIDAIPQDVIDFYDAQQAAQ